MENAQIISLSRQMGLRRQLDVLAHNMANINTNGYKNADLLFEEYLMPDARHKGFRHGDQKLYYTRDWATVSNFRSGAIQQTDNTFDMAIQGDGFFVVQTPAGERYTRDGSFQLNSNGELVTSEGHNVLADGGFVTFAPGETRIMVDENGSVTSSEGVKGVLRIAEFDDPQTLRREGDTLFAGENPIFDNASRIVHMSVERSNVSGVSEMAEMIRVTRAYTSIANLQKRQDELRRNAIKVLGNLNA